MDLFFYHDHNHGVFETFKTEKERNEDLLIHINELYVNDGIYDDCLISDIAIGVLTHELRYKPTKIRKENEEWDYSEQVDSVGVYEIKQINRVN